MEKVSFLTPVTFGNQQKLFVQSLLETVDSYFYTGILDGRKAFVIPGPTQDGVARAVLSKDSSACWATALKVLTYCTAIIPTIMLIAKVILRSTQSFYIVDPKIELEKGMKKTSKEKIDTIKNLISQILEGKEDKKIKWYVAQGNNRVFSFKKSQKIFKMAVQETERGFICDPKRTKKRFDNMVKAKEVCLAHRLDLLITPAAQTFDVEFDGGKVTLIAEEYQKIQQDEGAQEELYKLSGLDETIKQLVTFIAKTGFSDVTWRNVPIVDDASNFKGNRRVALIDTQEMGNAALGLVGRRNSHHRGLIECLHSETQMWMAVAQAYRHGITMAVLAKTWGDEIFKRVGQRVNEIKLQFFYEEKGILEDPYKLIQVDLASLELPLKEEIGFSSGITVKDAVDEVIKQINQCIRVTSKDASQEKSTKDKRYILLDFNTNDYLRNYHEQGAPKSSEINTKQGFLSKWLRRIVEALVEKRHLFALEKVNGHGYFVQA